MCRLSVSSLGTEVFHIKSELDAKGDGMEGAGAGGWQRSTLSNVMRTAAESNGGMGATCPDITNKCTGVARRERWCLNLPNIFAVSVIWAPEWAPDVLSTLLDLITQKVRKPTYKNQECGCEIRNISQGEMKCVHQR